MFIFPEMGLGVIAAQGRRVTNEMFVAATRALSECSPARKVSTASLYPMVEDVREVSRRVALCSAFGLVSLRVLDGSKRQSGQNSLYKYR